MQFAIGIFLDNICQGLAAISPCFTDMLGWYNGEIVDDNLKDVVPGRGTHEATKPVSLEFSGAQYGELAEAVTLVGDFMVSLKTIPVASANSRAFLSDGSANTNYLRINSGGPQLAIKINGAYYSANVACVDGIVNEISYERIADQLTTTCNGVSATITVNTGDLTLTELSRSNSEQYNSNLWDIYAEDSTGVKFHNFLAQGTGATCESVVGPAVTLNGFTLDDDWTQDARFGHSWNLASHYYGANGYIPEDPNNPGYAVTGEALNRIGTARQNMGITGYTGDFDGVAYSVLDSPVILSGDFKITTHAIISNFSVNQSIIGAGTSHRVRISATSGRFYLITPDGANTYSLSLIPPVGEVCSITVTRVGSEITVTVVADSIGVLSDSHDFTTASDWAVDQIGGANAADQLLGTIEYFKVYDSNDTLIHHWVCQSSRTKLQDKIYDIIGGNHATLTGATLPFFTAEIEGSAFGDGGSTGLADNVELTTNGDISEGATGWTPNVAAVGVTFNNSIQYPVTHDDYAEVKQLNKCVVGKTYKYSVDIKSKVDSSITVTLQVGRTQIYGNIIEGLSLGTITGSVVATHTDGFSISVRTNGVIEIDNISVQEIPDAIIPADPDNPGYDIYGNPLTFKGALDAPADLLMLTAPETPEMWEADSTLNKWLDTAGIAIPRDPYTLDINYVNQYFSGYTEVNNKEAINYNNPIVGYCLLETKKYLDIIQYVIDDLGNQVQNDSGDDVVV